MGEHRKIVLGLHNLCGISESGFDVADVGYAPATAGGSLRRPGGELLCLCRVTGTAFDGNRAFIPAHPELVTRHVRLPPVVGNNRDAGSEGVATLSSPVHDKCVMYAGKRLDFVQIGTDCSTPENRTLFKRGIEHALRFDVDTEYRFSGNDFEVFDSGNRLSDDLEIRGVLQSRIDRRRDIRRPGRQRRVGRPAPGRAVRDHTRARGEFPCGHVQLL